jgi:hypothetical protein
VSDNILRFEMGSPTSSRGNPPAFPEAADKVPGCRVGERGYRNVSIEATDRRRKKVKASSGASTRHIARLLSGGVMLSVGSGETLCYRRWRRPRAAGEAVALGIIKGLKGSGPQKVGTKALFYPDGRINSTLGGGCPEAEIQQRAVQSLWTR